MGTQQPVGAGTGQDLDEAVAGTGDMGAGIGGEGELAEAVFDTGLLERVLGLAHRRRLGVGVDHRGDRVGVDVAGLAGHDLDRDHGLVLGLVRQHGAGNHVADGEDCGHAGPESLIHRDAALVVAPHPDLIQPETGGIGPPPDGDQHHLAFEGRGRAARRRFHVKRHIGAVGHGARHLGAEPEFDSLPGQCALHVPGDVGVHAGHDAVEELDHRDGGTEPAPHRAQLEPDIAAADDHQPRRHFGERQRAGRGHDAALVDLDAGQAGRFRAGRDQDAAGLQGARRRAAVGRFDRHLAGGGDARGAADSLDPVLLQQKRNALGQPVDDVVLARQHDTEVEPHIVGHHAMGAEPVTRLGIIRGRLQQRLGRDAADIQAGAAEGCAPVHAGDRHAELGGADGADIPGRTAADDDEIVGRIRHVVGPLRRPAGCAPAPRCTP